MINANAHSLHPHVLAGLPCFCSAAKHLSFTRAATELNLTQGAVSQRIKKLEMLLGFSLFIRFNRRLQLTPEAEQLLAQVKQSMHQIDNTLRDIRANNLSSTLTLSAPPSFALSWLAPRLQLLHQNYPDLRIKIETHSRLVDLYNESIDLAIYYGQGHYPGLAVTTLLEEQLVPVCSPDYAHRHALHLQPERLDTCTLLHDTYAWPQAGAYAEWAYWAEQQGLTLDTQQGYCFDMHEMAIRSALTSTGVALGRRLLIQPYLDSGALITPFPDTSIAAGQYYSLVTHKERAQQPAIQAFRTWLEGLLI